jgi:hypothetical protein
MQEILGSLRPSPTTRRSERSVLTISSGFARLQFPSGREVEKSLFVVVVVKVLAALVRTVASVRLPELLYRRSPDSRRKVSLQSEFRGFKESRLESFPHSNEGAPIVRMKQAFDFIRMSHIVNNLEYVY